MTHLGSIVNDVLLWEIFKNKRSGRTTLAISSTTWYEVRHVCVESEYLSRPPPPPG